MINAKFNTKKISLRSKLILGGLVSIIIPLLSG